MPQKTHTKILATIGPSSASKEQIEKLIDAGCDAFRFNFSHGTHAEHKERFEIVRKLSKEKNRQEGCKGMHGIDRKPGQIDTCRRGCRDLGAHRKQ